MNDLNNSKFPYKLALSLIPIVLVVVFSLQNSRNTLVKIFFIETEAPLIILFLVCFAIGLLIGLIAFLGTYRTIKKQNKIIEELYQKINNLENKQY
jgi:uncharacterized integral membrane protein